MSKAPDDKKNQEIEDFHNATTCAVEAAKLIKPQNVVDVEVEEDTEALMKRLKYLQKKLSKLDNEIAHNKPLRIVENEGCASPGKWSIMAASFLAPKDFRDSYLGCRSEIFEKDAKRMGQRWATLLYNWDTVRDLIKGLIGRLTFGKLFGLGVIGRYFS